MTAQRAVPGAVQDDGAGDGAAEQDWLQANQRCLVAELAALRAALDRHAGRAEHVAGSDAQDLAPPPALEVVCQAFALSTFERAVLLLCAGVELDAGFGASCAAAAAATGTGTGTGTPSFALALAALPDAHWSALRPDGPLRRWHLVEVAPGGPLTTAALRVDEHVLHALTGVAGRDPRLTGVVSAPVPVGETTPGQEPAVHRLAEQWSHRHPSDTPLVVLTGADRSARTAVAARAARAVGLDLSLLDPAALPDGPTAREELARLLERESVLTGTAFLLDADADTHDGARWPAVDALTARTGAPVAVSAPDPPPLSRRGVLAVDVPAPSAAEQRDLWRRHAGPDVRAEALVAAFDLDAASIRRAAGLGDGSTASLWQACRALDRPRLSAHAQRVEATATWDDLVLPPAQRQALALLVAHVRHRVTVYDDWGMRRGRSTGTGSTAVFAGPSGTGKTFGAEVVAHELGLDLYRVDLSAVVSKYIGETEKNLRQVFDAADHSSVVLLFDEADALFGKRTEVRDSHDRYANLEVSYLLQRMEAYRGVAVLTTNAVEALDAALLRRVRFVVPFPFPDEPLRVELWRRAFPAATPTAGLDLTALARLDLSGGTIRNVAVSAAFLAAEAGEPVRTSHVLQAARVESGKLGRPLPSLGTKHALDAQRRDEEPRSSTGGKADR